MRFEACVYFDGPLTKWNRARKHWEFQEQHGLRVPLEGVNGIMPPPDEREVVDRKKFRTSLGAQLWALWRLKGFDTSKLVGEVRPL